MSRRDTVAGARPVHSTRIVLARSLARGRSNWQISDPT
uniref:Uncharacterized protein n=1 Tax=Arundo donax TaxID=35708 RepID=A0A0A8Y2E0_ARUDO